MAKVLSRLDILLHANTANYVREMKKATDKTKQELKSVADYGKLVGGQLGMAFATLGSAVSISHIVQTADRMQDLASKVRINTQSMEEYHAVLHDLRKISTDYWTAIDGITDLYASSKRALDSLGASQRQVLDFTRNITMAMSIGGGSAQAQEAALIQLGQAMNMGVLRGQEFNSVSAQAPVIIDLLTDSLKVSQSELRAMAAEGKITSQVMMDAVLGGYDKLQETINKMPTTFAQGIQNIKSQYDFLVDDVMNQNSLLSQNLANAALWIAEHFRTLVSAGAMVGAVWLTSIASNSALVTSFVGLTGATLANTKASIANAFSVQGQINAYNVLSTRMMLLRLTKAHYIDLTKTAIATTTAYARSLVGLATSFNTATASARLHTLALAGVATAKRGAMGVSILATRAATGLGSAFVSLGRIITAHPIITLTAVIGAVIARTEGLEGAIKSLGDAFNIAGALVMDFIGGVVDGLGIAWTATANYFDGLMGGSANATGFAQTAFGGFFANTEKGFVGVGQIIARTFDLGGATVVWFVSSADKNIKAMATSVNNTFKKMGNFAVTVFEKAIHNIIDDVNDTIKGFSAIWEFFGGSPIPLIAKKSFGRFEYATPEYGSAGNIADHNPHYLENAWLNKHKELTRASNQANQANLNLANSTASLGKASDKASKGADKLNKANKDVAKSAKLAQDEIDKLNKAYVGQIRAFQKMEWELHKPFISELDKINFEIEHGQFVHALDKQKKDLQKLARAVDELKNVDTLRNMSLGWKKEIAMLGKENSFDELLYDFNNVANALSEFDRKNLFAITYDEKTGEELEKITAFRHYLQNAVSYDVGKATHELNRQNLELYNQLELLRARDEISKSFITLQQEKIAFLGKYNSLLDNGFEKEYQDLQAQYERHEQLKRDLLVQTELRGMQDNVNQIQKEFALLNIYGDIGKELFGIEQKRLDVLEKYHYLLKDGHTEQFALIEEQAGALAYQQEQLTAAKHYDELVKSLRTEEQKRLQALKEQLVIISAQQKLNGTQPTIARSDILANALGLPQKELNPFEKLNQENANRLAMIDTFMRTQQEIYRDNQAELQRIEQEGVAARLAVDTHYQQAKNKLLTTAIGEQLDIATNGIKSAFGEQSRAYQMMFAMQKGFAIAQAGIAIHKAISDAFAEGTTLAQKFAGIATATTEGMKIISAIRQIQSPVGQAHDGIMSVPKSGTWNLEKGERVLPKHTAQNLDNTLNRLQGNGGQIINVNVTVHADGGDVQSSHNLGKNLGNVIKLAVQAELQKERRQGGLLYGR